MASSGIKKNKCLEPTMSIEDAMLHAFQNIPAGGTVEYTLPNTYASPFVLTQLSSDVGEEDTMQDLHVYSYLTLADDVTQNTVVVGVKNNTNAAIQSVTVAIAIISVP